MAISHPLTLEPGDNSFELSAVNQDALAGYEEFETTRLPPQHVHYQRAPARPPEVVLEKVIAPGDRTVPGLPLTIRAGEAIVVAVPRVRVLGRIVGAAALSDGGMECRADVPATRRVRCQPGGNLRLERGAGPRAGGSDVSISRRVADSEFAEADLILEYRPPLPELTELTLDPPGDVIEYQGRQSRSAPGPVQGPPAGRPLVVTPIARSIMVNDKDSARGASDRRRSRAADCRCPAPARG